jgi:hypothetical protein
MNAGGTSASDAAEIVTYSTVTVLLVTKPDNFDFAVKLPTDADIGDVIEIYYVSGSGQLSVFAPDGGTLNALSPTVYLPVTYARFRKVSSTAWYGI